jgi:hypothetical protein
MEKHTLSNSADKQQIVERLGAIQPNSVRQWGRMTVHQMICHLSDSFRVTMGLKPWRIERVSIAPIPLPYWFVKWVALDLPFKWPHGTPTRPEVDSERGGTTPMQWDADRAELLRLLVRMAAASYLWADERGTLDALGLSPHGSSSAAVRGVGVWARS